jgi:3',5'-cyclic AMP phosphodiesterase CpdA
MRVAIIADIHGNQIAFEAVLHDLKQQPAVDQLIIAGDLCLNGPQPREVLRTVKALHCPVIQGTSIRRLLPRRVRVPRSTILFTGHVNR